MFTLKSFHARLRASGIHLGLCIVVAAGASLLVFGCWYPGAYRAMSGGQTLFLLVITVDVILGPVLTFIVFNPAKRRLELRRDLAVIGILQIAALGYGLHTVFEVRPIALVYEPGRFRVVTSLDIAHEELPKALPSYRSLPFAGPWTLGTREPSPQESEDALFMALQGFDIGQRPSFWESYDNSVDRIVRKARPVSLLLKQYPHAAEDVAQILAKEGRHMDEVKFLPVIAREAAWVIVIDAYSAKIFGFLPYDGFF